MTININIIKSPNTNKNPVVITPKIPNTTKITNNINDKIIMFLSSFLYAIKEHVNIA